MNYFKKLLNEDHVGNEGLGINKVKEIRDHRYLCKIRVSEVKEALRRIKIGNVLGLNGIPIEILKGMRDDSLWSTKLFNKIIKNKKCQI